MDTPLRQSEWANSLTHGGAAAAALGGLVLMIVWSALYGTDWHVVACSIYGASLVFLFTASTLYHSSRSPAAKRIWRAIDHSAIFLLIAGTYTPFMLATSLRGPWGWSLLGSVWGLALAGVILKMFFTGRFGIASTALYLLMGWAVVIAAKPLWLALPAPAFFLLLAGGTVYSLGVLFYAWKRLPYSHAIWHLFVVGGSACHYFAVLFYVIPRH